MHSLLQQAGRAGRNPEIEAKTVIMLSLGNQSRMTEFILRNSLGEREDLDSDARQVMNKNLRNSFREVVVYATTTGTCRRIFHEVALRPESTTYLDPRFCLSDNFRKRYPTALPCDFCVNGALKEGDLVSLINRSSRMNRTANGLIAVIDLLEAQKAEKGFQFHITADLVRDFYCHIGGKNGPKSEIPKDVVNVVEKECLNLGKSVLTKPLTNEVVMRALWIGLFEEKEIGEGDKCVKAISVSRLQAESGRWGFLEEISKK